MKIVDSKCDHCVWKSLLNYCHKYNEKLVYAAGFKRYTILLKITDKCFHEDGFEEYTEAGV